MARRARLLGAVTAVWLAASAAPAAGQEVTYHQLPENTQPSYIVTGPDGALWFTELGPGRIGRLSVDGELREFGLVRPGSKPRMITAGNGAIYYTDSLAGQIGRLELDGRVKETSVQNCPKSACGYRLPDDLTVAPDGQVWFSVDTLFATGAAPGDSYHDVCSLDARLQDGECTNIDPVFVPYGHASAGPVLGPDGAMWFTNKYLDVVGRIPASGPREVFKFPLEGDSFDNDPDEIVAGPDGALWFTEPNHSVIDRFTTTGERTRYSLPRVDSRPTSITAGPDGAVWFTEVGEKGNAVGRIDARGTITEFPLGDPDSRALGITTGPDGAMWFTESNNDRIGRLAVPARPAPAGTDVAPRPPEPPARTQGEKPSDQGAPSPQPPPSGPAGPPAPGPGDSAGGFAGAPSSPALLDARLRPGRLTAPARRRRLSVALDVARPVRITVRLQRVAGKRRVVIRRLTRRLGAGRHTVRLRLSRRGLRAGRHQVVVEVRDGKALASRTTLPLRVRAKR